MIKKLLLFLSLVWLAACSTTQVDEGAPDVLSGVGSQEYRIGVNDQLQVSVWRNPELTLAVPVRPDGKISVPLVGDVMAAGNSAGDLADEIEKKLDGYIRNPVVTVIVTSPNSATYLQRVRITGAVKSPQSIIYQQGMKILDVVLQAGGVTDFGAANNALLYRETAEGLKAYPVRLDDILKKGRLETNYELAPSDIITVPERIF